MNKINLSTCLENRKILLSSIFICAFIIKLLIFYWVTDPIIFYKYPYFAEQIAQGKAIGERLLDISPFYLFVNLLSYYIYGTNWEALVFIQIILGSINCVFIFLIGERIFNKKVGIFAAAIIMLYGNLTLIDLTLEPEAVLIFLNSLVLLIALKAIHTEDNKKKLLFWFLTGLMTGLCVITKPNSLLILAGLLIWIWFSCNDIKMWIKSSILLIAGTIILIAPVTTRNYIKFNDFVLVTADGGKVFFHGNGQGANGMARADLPQQGFIEESAEEPDYAHTLFRKTARTVSGKYLKPSECSAFWTQQTLTHIKTNFSSWLYLELKKICFFWKSYEVHDIDSNYKNFIELKKLPLINFGIIFLLGLSGMFFARKSFRQSFLLSRTVISYLATVLIFFTSARYRIPAAPFLAIFAAFAIKYLFDLLKGNKFKKIFIIFFSLFVLGLAGHACFQKEIAAYDRWQMATRVYYSLGGNMFFKKGMYVQAVENLKKAVELAPDFAPAYNLLGKSFAILNKYDDAEINFNKVIELAPNLEEGYLNLGLLYRLQGDNEKARSYLAKAFSIRPDSQKIKKYMEQ